MALLFCDSFDHYTNTNAHILSKYDALSGNTASNLGVNASGRNGAQCLRLASTSEFQLQKFLPPRQTLVVGFAFYFESDPAATVRQILSFRNGSANHVRLYSHNSLPGVLSVANAANTQVGQTLPIPMVSWVFVELKVYIHPTLGTVEVRIDGQVALLLENINTQSGSENTINAIMIGRDSGSNMPYWRMDDFYVLDNTGTRNNNFLGDVRVKAYTPNIQGTYDDFLPSTGTDHVAMVNSVTPDDTTYLESQASGDVESFGYTNEVENLSVVGVQLLNRLSKTNAGNSFAAVHLKSGAVETFGAPESVSISPRYFAKTYDENPDGGVAWNISSMNAIEAGVRVTDTI